MRMPGWMGGVTKWSSGQDQRKQLKAVMEYNQDSLQPSESLLRDQADQLCMPWRHAAWLLPTTSTTCAKTSPVTYNRYYVYLQQSVFPIMCQTNGSPVSQPASRNYPIYRWAQGYAFTGPDNIPNRILKDFSYTFSLLQ